jgi:hypothetical protein
MLSMAVRLSSSALAIPRKRDTGLSVVRSNDLGVFVGAILKILPSSRFFDMAAS